MERVISQIASRGGRRLELRYLGTARNNAWLKNRTAALDLRNLLRRGLHHRQRGMGAGLTSPAAPQAPCSHPATPARLGAGGKSDHAPARTGLAYYRTDGIVGAFPPQITLMFRTLIAKVGDLSPRFEGNPTSVRPS